MSLEETIHSLKNTGINLAIAGLATIGAYNLAGYTMSNNDFSSTTEKLMTAGILSAGEILGYKAGAIINRIRRKTKRDIARSKTLAKVSSDEDFMKRQGINRGEFGIIRKGLRGLLTVPFGGALGYYPGAVGIAPLCIYFGDRYSWSSDASAGSGPIAGAVIAAYAVGEMTARGQYERLVTTAAALGGVTGGFFLQSKLELGLWGFLALCAATGTASGAVGNIIYNKIKRAVKK
jgi:hypothetical protein